jgi:CRP/FNR family transcriptional regulator, cyclic AMP receptor protein
MFNKHDARVEQLVSVSLFSSCTHSELRELAGITTEIDAPRGTVFCREGAIGNDCFVVVDGEVAVTIADEHVCIIGPGGFFGEMALLDGGPRVATVTALSDMRLLVMSRQEFASLLTRVPSVSRRMLAAIGSRLRLAEAQLHPAHVGI